MSRQQGHVAEHLRTCAACADDAEMMLAIKHALRRRDGRGDECYAR